MKRQSNITSIDEMGEEKRPRTTERGARFEGRFAEVQGFSNYIKELKELFKDDANLDSTTIRAASNHCLRQLPGKKMMALICEQTCSRNIEFLCKKFSELTTNILSQGNPGKYSNEDTEIVKTGANTVLQLANKVGDKMLYVSSNQYGSHSVEALIRSCISILSYHDQLSLIDPELCADLVTLLDSIIHQVFTEDVSRWLFFVTHNTQTYAIRTLSVELLKILTLVKRMKSTANYIKAFAKRICGKEIFPLYNDAKASPTLQSVIYLYKALCDDTEKEALSRALFTSDEEGNLDIEYFDTMVNEGSVSNHMTEFLIRNVATNSQLRYVLKRYVLSNNRLADAIRNKKDSEIYVIKAILGAYNLSNDQLLALLQKLPLKECVASQRSLLQILLKQPAISSKNISKQFIVSFEASVREIGELEDTANPYEFLLNYRKRESEDASTIGLTILTAVLSSIQNSGAFSDNSQADIKNLVKHCFADIRKSKKGIMLLQALLCHDSDKVKKYVIKSVLSNLHSLTFDVYGSYLVRDIANCLSGKRKSSFLTELCKFKSEISRRNPSLYAVLNLDAFTNSGDESFRSTE